MKHSEAFKQSLEKARQAARDKQHEQAEREHLGDADKQTGIYNPALQLPKSHEDRVFTDEQIDALPRMTAEEERRYHEYVRQQQSEIVVHRAAHSLLPQAMIVGRRKTLKQRSF